MGAEFQRKTMPVERLEGVSRLIWPEHGDPKEHLVGIRDQPEVLRFGIVCSCGGVESMGYAALYEHAAWVANMVAVK